MTSMSRFRASGRRATRLTAIVDLPLAGGPFSNTRFATPSPYESAVGSMGPVEAESVLLGGSLRRTPGRPRRHVSDRPGAVKTQDRALSIVRSMKVDHLRQVALRVEDMDRAVAFYRDVVGLELLARFDPPGLAFFDIGGTRLLLEADAPSSLLYLGVDDVADVTEQLREAGVTIVAEPHTIFVDEAGQFGSPGEAEELGFFRDSEGNLVGLAGRRARS